MPPVAVAQVRHVFDLERVRDGGDALRRETHSRRCLSTVVLIYIRTHMYFLT